MSAAVSVFKLTCGLFSFCDVEHWSLNYRPNMTEISGSLGYSKNSCFFS